MMINKFYGFSAKILVALMFWLNAAYPVANAAQIESKQRTMLKISKRYAALSGAKKIALLQKNIRKISKIEKRIDNHESKISANIEKLKNEFSAGTDSFVGNQPNVLAQPEFEGMEELATSEEISTLIPASSAYEKNVNNFMNGLSVDLLRSNLEKAKVTLNGELERIQNNDYETYSGGGDDGLFAGAIVCIILMIAFIVVAAVLTAAVYLIPAGVLLIAAFVCMSQE